MKYDLRVLCPKCFGGLDDLSFIIRRLGVRNGIRREQRVRENTKVSRCVADALTFGL